MTVTPSEPFEDQDDSSNSMPMPLQRRASAAALTLLVAGALLNLLAGLRRPLAERRILAGNEYAAAQRAAGAVQRWVPADASPAVVTPDRESSTWLREYLQWLIYPRTVTVLDLARGPLPPFSSDGDGYYLFFGRSGAPPLPPHDYRVLERDPAWVLARGSER